MFVPSLELLKKSWNVPRNFPDPEKVWKIEVKSWKNGKKSWVFWKLQVRHKWYFFGFGQISLHLACTSWKKIYSRVFNISIDHLHVFYNLESGKRNYSFGKILEKVLSFRSKICTNPGIFMSPSGGGTAIVRGHPSQSTFISHLVECWSSPGNGTCDLLLSGQALYQLS